MPEPTKLQRGRQSPIRLREHPGQDGNHVRTTGSPLVKAALAVLLYGGTVTITLLPQRAASWTAPGVIVLALVAVGVTVAFALRGRALSRAGRTPPVASDDAETARAKEIDQLEAAHALPAYEPHRTRRLGDGDPR